MNKPLLVGITGGIGSGKSTVAKIFEILGVPVYYADDRGKWLLVYDKELKLKVIESFGSESYRESGELNRQFLAEEVFSNPEKLTLLNTLVHPAVAADFSKWVEAHERHPYLLKEAALLIETGSYKALDSLICVMAAKDLRVNRVLLRDYERPINQIYEIMDNQVSDSKRKKTADFFIQNDGRSSLINQVLSLHQKLSSTRNRS